MAAGSTPRAGRIRTSESYVRVHSVVEAVHVLKNGLHLSRIKGSRRFVFFRSVERVAWLSSLAQVAEDRLDQRVREDFEGGRTVRLDGWILSNTEARQTALYYILNS